LAAWIPFVSQILRTDGTARRTLSIVKATEVSMAVAVPAFDGHEKEGYSLSNLEGSYSGIYFHLALFPLLNIAVIVAKSVTN
jgi:hypothetical protein